MDQENSFPLPPNQQPPQPTPEPEEAPKAQEVVMSEPVMIPRNPVVPILRIMTLVIFMEVVTILVVNLMRLVGISSETTSSLLVLLVIIKALILGGLLFWSLLPWANTAYYLSETQMVKKRLKKNVTSQEVTHELRQIESVRMDQGIFGRMFDYGDIILKLKTDQTKQVMVTDIQNPNHYKTVFDKYVSVSPPEEQGQSQ